MGTCGGSQQSCAGPAGGIALSGWLALLWVEAQLLLKAWMWGDTEHPDPMPVWAWHQNLSPQTGSKSGPWATHFPGSRGHGPPGFKDEDKNNTRLAL